MLVIAGARGSGKTHFVEKLKTHRLDLGVYISTDRIIKLAVRKYADIPINLAVMRGKIVADYLKTRCLRNGYSFTFETLFERKANVDFLREAREKGYFIIVIFLGTETHLINKRRIARRIAEGGNLVPEISITEGAIKNVEYFVDAIRFADDVRIYDNSREIKSGLFRPLLLMSKSKARWAIRAPLPDWLSEAFPALEFLSNDRNN